MIERPFNQVRDSLKENVKRQKDLTSYLYEKSDAITLWIIGFSIGALSVLATNFKDLKKAISPCYFHPILFFLCTSVIFGVLYRYWFLAIYKEESHIFDGLEVAFTRQASMDTESVLRGDESYEQVIVAAQNTTGNDYSNLLQLYNSSDPANQKILYDSLVKFYKETVEFAKKDMQLAFDFAADTYSKFYGKSKAEWLSIFKGQKKPKLSYPTVILIGRIFFILYLISFIIALILFSSSV